MSSSHIFVLMILAIVMAPAVIKVWGQNRREASKGATEEEANEMLDKIDMLEERIRVLERIITEKNIDLRDEIDRL